MSPKAIGLMEVVFPAYLYETGWEGQPPYLMWLPEDA